MTDVETAHWSHLNYRWVEAMDTYQSPLCGHIKLTSWFSSPEDQNDLQTLLQYEAIYFGIGLAAHHFAQASSEFNLDDWITRTFMPVLCQTEVRYEELLSNCSLVISDITTYCLFPLTSGAILRRRIAWVVSFLIFSNHFVLIEIVLILFSPLAWSICETRCGSKTSK